MSIIAPDVVVIVLGTNDTRLSRTADNFEAGLRAIIAAWRLNNPSCGFITVLPPENSQAVRSPLYREYYDRIVTIAGDTAAVEYVSLVDRWPSYSVSNSQMLCILITAADLRQLVLFTNYCDLDWDGLLKLFTD